jgi:hypothetical protein
MSYTPNRGIRIDDTTYLKLQVLAKKEERAVNNLIVYILKRHIADYETRHGIIEVDTDALYE